ncbi:MAG: metallophosphoesterase [Hyphomicrobiales bacterium]|nr:metallophosphoesterase [Alphaproteobacteria bacterium]
MFTLAHLSDVHLAPLPMPKPVELLSKRGLGYINWLRKRRSIHRLDILTALVADLKARAPDHVAVTGDLVNLSLPFEFTRGRDWLAALGEPRDVTFVPGNHDAYVRQAATFADRHWADFMRGDGGESFPFVRRRGPLALIGLSTSLPTLPLAATGRLHGDQLERLAKMLPRLKREQAFRVVLIHHPPVLGANYFRRLTNSSALREVLREHGAELVLHGHHHEASLQWLPGPRLRIPVIGVPSASGAGGNEDPSGYNLYEVEGVWGAWRCTMTARGWRDGGFGEVSRQTLYA